MARKAGQWEQEEVAQSHEGEKRCQPAMKRRCRVTALLDRLDIFVLHMDGDIPRVTFNQQDSIDGSDRLEILVMFYKTSHVIPSRVVVQSPVAMSPTPPYHAQYDSLYSFSTDHFRSSQMSQI
ncbi:hypothetical protein STEG23_000928 [Scotinomys teguina]